MHMHINYYQHHRITKQGNMFPLKSDIPVLSLLVTCSMISSPLCSQYMCWCTMPFNIPYSIPRCSMYRIFTYIWVIFGVNVG